MLRAMRDSFCTMEGLSVVSYQSGTGTKWLKRSKRPWMKGQVQPDDRLLTNRCRCSSLAQPLLPILRPQGCHHSQEAGQLTFHQGGRRTIRIAIVRSGREVSPHAAGFGSRPHMHVWMRILCESSERESDYVNKVEIGSDKMIRARIDDVGQTG